MKSNKFIENFEVFLYIRMVYYLVGMNIETKKLLSILVKKTEEDTTMSLGNHEGGNLYLLVTLHVKICGIEMVYVS
jgi:hypothetical protein